MRENICIYSHQANSSLKVSYLKLLGENLRGGTVIIYLPVCFQKFTGKIIQICHSSGRVSSGKALAIVHYFQGSASCSFLLQSLPVVRNWQMVRNVPWVKMCPLQCCVFFRRWIGFMQKKPLETYGMTVGCRICLFCYNSRSCYYLALTCPWKSKMLWSMCLLC